MVQYIIYNASQREVKVLLCSYYSLWFLPLDAHMQQAPLESAKGFLYNLWPEIPSLFPLEAWSMVALLNIG